MSARTIIYSAAGAGGGASPYWFATINGSGNAIIPTVAYNSTTDYIYVTTVMYDNGGNNTYTWAGVYTTAGVEVSPNKVYSTNGLNNALIAPAADGNSFFSCTPYATINYQKVSTAGAVLSGGSISGNYLQNHFNAATDSTDNLYWSFLAAPSDTSVIKINTSNATIAWQKKFTAPSSSGSNVGGMRVSSDGYVYFTTALYPSTGLIKTEVFKINASTGATVASARIDPFGTLGSGVFPYGAPALDSSGNVWVAGTSTLNQGSGAYYVFIAKFNSSLTLLSSYYINVSALNQSIAIDSSGNIYVVCTVSGVNAYLLLFKLNSSYVMQWQRAISATYSLFSNTAGLTLDSLGNPIITARYATSSSSSDRNTMLARLPATGVANGTYGPFTVTTPTYSVVASALTQGTPTGSLTNTAFTSASYTVTPQAKTITNTVYPA